MIIGTPQKKTEFFMFMSSEKALLAAILIAGTVLYWYGTWFGLNMTNDSFDYLQSASFLSQGKWHALAGSGQFTSWPPLFGVLIFLWSMKLGINPVFMQFIIMICNFFLLLEIGKRVLPGPVARIIWFAASFTSVGFIMIHVFLWSEPLFLAIQLSLIIVVDNFISTKKLNWLLLSILFSVLLCLQRNAGIFIIAAIALTVFLSMPGRRGLISAILLFLAGIFTFSGWNLIVSIPGTGPFVFLKHEYFSGFLLNIWNYIDVVSAWFLPRKSGIFIRLFFVFLLSIWILLSRRKEISILHKDYSLTRLICIIIVFYIIGMSSIGRIDPWETERYLSIIYPFILLVIIVLALKNTDLTHKSFTRLIIIAFLGMWILYIEVRSTINVVNWHERSKTTHTWISNP